MRKHGIDFADVWRVFENEIDVIVSYFSIVSFCILSSSMLQATYLHIWFVEFVSIKWNSALILSDVFDAVLYFCLAIILIFQFKIIYRFTREKFQVKIS